MLEVAHIFMSFCILSLVIFVIVFGIVSISISDGNVWSRLSFFGVNWTVEEIVDEVELSRLLTNVITTGWHADQMDLEQIHM